MGRIHPLMQSEARTLDIASTACYVSSIDRCCLRDIGDRFSLRIASRCPNGNTPVTQATGLSRSGGMADAMDSKSIVPKGRVGSSPTFGTLRDSAFRNLKSMRELRNAFFFNVSH